MTQQYSAKETLTETLSERKNPIKNTSKRETNRQWDMQTARNLNRETYRHNLWQGDILLERHVKRTQMEGISDRETNYQRETLTREIGRYLTHSKTLILTLLSLELQKWLCSQNWSEFNQKSISVSQKSLSCLRPMFASSRFCAAMNSMFNSIKRL